MQSHETEAVNEFQRAIERSVGNMVDWTFTLDDVHQTIFRGENLRIYYFEIRGGGDAKVHKNIIVIVGYGVNQSSRRRRKRWHCFTVREAIESLFRFVHDNTICIECGDLLQKDLPCLTCEFFRCYQKFQGLDMTCAICQEKVYRTMLSCGHCFHYTCLTKMEPNNAKCPVCRQDFTNDELEDFFYPENDDEDGMDNTSDEEKND